MRLIKEKTVAFTGRVNLAKTGVAQDMNLENVVRTELYAIIEELYAKGKVYYMSGMSCGFDLLAADVLSEFKNDHKDVKLIAVIPFLGQELKYSAIDKIRYRNIMASADIQIIINDGDYTKESYIKRDSFLVENSSTVICYSSSKGWGRGYVIRRALNIGSDIRNIYLLLDNYFSNTSQAKHFLQNYPDVSSFRYSKEGVIFKGYNQCFPVNFSNIESVGKSGRSLCFLLANGVKFLASLDSEDINICLPKIEDVRLES